MVDGDDPIQAKFECKNNRGVHISRQLGTVADSEERSIKTNR